MVQCTTRMCSDYSILPLSFPPSLSQAVPRTSTCILGTSTRPDSRTSTRPVPGTSAGSVPGTSTSVPSATTIPAVTSLELTVGFGVGIALALLMVVVMAVVASLAFVYCKRYEGSHFIVIKILVLKKKSHQESAV